MNNCFRYTIIGLCSIIFVFILFKVIVIRRKFDILENKVQLSIYELQSRNASLINQRKLSLMTENLLVDPKLLTNPQMSYSSLLIRLHEGICMDCYLETIKKLINLLEERKMNLSILASYKYSSTFVDIKNNLNIMNYPFINLDYGFSLPADSASAPYLFIIDSNNRIKNVFFLQNDNFQITNNYCDMVQRK